MSNSRVTSLIIYTILLLAVWFVILPMFQDNQMLRSSISILNAEVGVARDVINEIKAQEEILSEKDEEIKKLELALPIKRELSSIIAIFEEAATFNGLVLTSLNVREEERDSNSTKSILQTFVV